MPILSRFTDDLRQIVAYGSICPGHLPVADESYVLDKFKRLNVPFGIPVSAEDAVQVDPEETEACPQALAARKGPVRYDSQPIADLAHEHLGIASMSADVVARGIGQDSLIAIRLLLKDEALLIPKTWGSVVPAPQVEPQLEGHVEARLISWLERLDPGDVVNAVAAGADEIADLVDPDPAGIGLLRGDPRLETTFKDSKDQRLKEREVLPVERTVDEETALEAVEVPRHRAPWNGLNARDFQRHEEEAGSPRIRALRPRYG